MALHGSEQLDEQHERAQRHVKSVKARQNEECRTVDSATKRQPQVVVSMNIFRYLKHQKDRAKQNR